jgi:hypothetical protein
MFFTANLLWILISVSTLWLLFKFLAMRDLPMFTSVTVHSVIRVKSQVHGRASQTKTS